MNLQFVRKILAEDSLITEYINEKFGQDSRILYSNFGFVVVPLNREFVYKFYLSKGFLEKHSISSIESYYFKEQENYDIFKSRNINIPFYEFIGQNKIGENIFYCAGLENIRKYHSKFEDFSEIKASDLAEIMKKIHSISEGFIHGNIHPSNFFVKNNQLGIFDLVSFGKGDSEKDLSRIYTYSDFNENYFQEFLSCYGKLQIKEDNIYRYVIADLYDTIKYADTSQTYKEKYKDIIKKLLKRIK